MHWKIATFQINWKANLKLRVASNRRKKVKERMQSTFTCKVLSRLGCRLSLPSCLPPVGQKSVLRQINLFAIGVSIFVSSFSWLKVHLLLLFPFYSFPSWSFPFYSFFFIILWILLMNLLPLLMQLKISCFVSCRHLVLLCLPPHVPSPGATSSSSSSSSSIYLFHLFLSH